MVCIWVPDISTLKTWGPPEPEANPVVILEAEIALSCPGTTSEKNSSPSLPPNSPNENLMGCIKGHSGREILSECSYDSEKLDIPNN